MSGEHPATSRLSDALRCDRLPHSQETLYSSARPRSPASIDQFVAGDLTDGEFFLRMRPSTRRGNRTAAPPVPFQLRRTLSAFGFDASKTTPEEIADMPLIRRQRRGDDVFLELVEEVYDGDAKRGTIRHLRTLGREQKLRVDPLAHRRAIVWSVGRTLGSITLHSEEVLGHFPQAASGQDAVLPCDIVPAGKFRNGKSRWWCRTHQVHWGTVADVQAAAERSESGISCSNATLPINYVIDPFLLDPIQYPGGIGVWVSLPPAISVGHLERRDVKIHVHARSETEGNKSLDQDYDAIQLKISNGLLFGTPDLLDRINITPPAAWSFVLAFERNLPLDCLMCTYCQEPHLDLGDFAINPHKKHFCASCGRDSNWSRTAIVSNPLKRVFDQLTNNKNFVVPDRTLNLDDVAAHTYQVWSSTPALVWTSNRPQERGIHVHAYDETGKELVNETFGKVLLHGNSLNRTELLEKMVEAAARP